ncbi:thialysine N-epsilon-acetyltransferase-like [Chrysoperla carnea]|uniref:thialysine N-epsilon-acetyltransferase-like n=1 Tax=Chrysoperla carnea TaxID=189513 RepID=UPI001D06864A|nr:thialysine N-epsilon-acetyltransferase-like [Chrysoperla carnea]
MDFNIRKAVSNDMIHVYGMIKELAEFENMPNGPQIDEKKLIEDGFESENPIFKCFVAECTDSKIVVGYAIYFPIYSTWEGRALFLEDLYVKPEYRKHHIGLKLIKAVAKQALSENCKRLDLHVLSWNPAMKFYEKLNAVNLTKSEDWNFVRFGTDAIAKLAE